MTNCRLKKEEVFSRNWVNTLNSLKIQQKNYFSPQNGNLYAYAANNPVHYIDPTGMAAGDPFGRPEDAAMDWAKTYADDSICRMREFGSTIYSYIDEETQELQYSYNIPKMGSIDSVEINEELKPGQTAVSIIHSHSDFDPRMDEDNPSDLDKYSAGLKNYDCEYLVTPLGNLYSFNKDGKINLLNLDVALPRDPWADVTDKDGYADCSDLFANFHPDPYIDRYGNYQRK